MRYLFLLCGLSCAAFATTYYVATTGSDVNDGSSVHPFLTIQKGINSAASGDTVFVEAGSYSECDTFRTDNVVVRGDVYNDGSPAVTMDGTRPVTTTWLAAPSIGAGVYEATNVTGPTYGPYIVMQDSEQFLKAYMDSVGDYMPGTGRQMLAYDTNRYWHPFGMSESTRFWDDLRCLFCNSNTGDTTYIRFRNNVNPNTLTLRASHWNEGFYIEGKRNITVEHLKMVGYADDVLGWDCSHLTIKNCVLRGGFGRVLVGPKTTEADSCTFINNDIAGGMDTTMLFGEWEGGGYARDTTRRHCASYCFRKFENADVGDVNIQGGTGHTISGNRLHDNFGAILLSYSTRHTSVFSNAITHTSGPGVESYPNNDSDLIYGNTFIHSAISIRISAIGMGGVDTSRLVYFYNNTSYQDSDAGAHIFFHKMGGCDNNIIHGTAKAPRVWFYHNSFSGGAYALNPVWPACESMRVVNNVFSSGMLTSNSDRFSNGDTTCFAGFDYNFLGGLYSYWGYMKFAGYDRHNQWSTDTILGNEAHQVWPLNVRHDWLVPDTSTARKAALDLSHKFVLRGVTYFPLPGLPAVGQPLDLGAFEQRYTVNSLDVGVQSIVAPVGTVDSGATITPQARVKNLGTSVVTFPVTFRIGTSYSNTQTVSKLASGDSVIVSFPDWTAGQRGTYATRCSTELAQDIHPENDRATGIVSVIVAGWYGWSQVTSLPAGREDKPVGVGGCLAYDAGTDLVYASTGNRTGDFYSYSVPQGTWTTLASIPLGADKKAPYTGSVVCSDGHGELYLTKGNNTAGFWGYDADTKAWTQLTNVPKGSSGKKVKHGAGIAWATKHGVGNVYLLKGYCNEFYKYNPTTNGWTQLLDAPIGLASHVKYNDGSWLVADADAGHYLYAFKAKYHEMYIYDTDADTWSQAKRPMPIPGTAGCKKAKDGSCAAWYSGSLYAFKGNNTTEFWRYFPLGDSWHTQDDIPLVGTSGQHKKVMAGAALTGARGIGLFAFKGNRSLEFWRYTPYDVAAAVAQPDRGGVMAYSTSIGNFSFTITPNPLMGGLTTVRYNLPRAGLAWLRVYNVAGQQTMTSHLALARSGVASLDLRHISSGVYLVKLSSFGFEASQRLVVQR